jgi:anti-anti-sigma factor
MLTADRLADVLDGALATVAADRDAGTDMTAGETPSVVCDLRGVTFLGASGLDVFATAQQTAVTRGVRLVVVAEHRTVVLPFSLTALDRSLTLVGTHPALGRRAATGGERR